MLFDAAIYNQNLKLHENQAIKLVTPAPRSEYYFLVEVLLLTWLFYS